MYFFRLCRRKPEQVKAFIFKAVRQELGPDYDIATHFTPRYKPWDQRMCLVPDSDLFRAIKGGRAEVVTDTIESFTENGIKLKSGRELAADIVVTATGLVMELLGGMDVEVDGRQIDFAKTLNYKGMMFSDVPNLASTFGYTNASWTLKCDLTCGYVCRLLNYMDAKGHRQCTPRIRDASMPADPFLDFSSGYVQRAIDRLPKQGAKAPWKLYQNYALDIMSLKFGALQDGAMEFAAPAPENPARVPETLAN
jgi:cation diffusion facilitator CzcD-associated flavoprotein CzcO